MSRTLFAFHTSTTFPRQRSHVHAPGNSVIQRAAAVFQGYYCPFEATAKDILDALRCPPGQFCDPDGIGRCAARSLMRQGLRLLPAFQWCHLVHRVSLIELSAPRGRPEPKLHPSVRTSSSYPSRANFDRHPLPVKPTTETGRRTRSRCEKSRLKIAVAGVRFIPALLAYLFGHCLRRCVDHG